jgi:hypothetical protein
MLEFGFDLLKEAGSIGLEILVAVFIIERWIRFREDREKLHAREAAVALVASRIDGLVRDWAWVLTSLQSAQNSSRIAQVERTMSTLTASAESRPPVRTNPGTIDSINRVARRLDDAMDSISSAAAGMTEGMAESARELVELMRTDRNAMLDLSRILTHPDPALTPGDIGQAATACLRKDLYLASLERTWSDLPGRTKAQRPPTPDLDMLMAASEQVRVVAETVYALCPAADPKAFLKTSRAREALSSLDL